MENLQAQNGKYANKTGSGRGARSNAERYRNSQQGEQILAEVEQGKGTGATVPAPTQGGQSTQQAAPQSTIPAHLQAFNNSNNAPSKQEQEKANQQKKELLQNQQNTSQLIGSFANKELDFALDNLDVEGASTDEQITNVMRDPDNYKIEMVTEQNKINDIVNGGNGLQTPVNNNLSDKYKDVVSIAKITDRNTGKTENVYLTTQQAGLFNDMRKYNKQYANEFKKAMGNPNSPKYTNAEIMDSLDTVISSPSLSRDLTAKYDVPNTTDNIRKIAYYSANHPDASEEEIRDYVNSTSIDTAYYDNVYKGYDTMRDVEKHILSLSKPREVYNTPNDSDIIERQNYNTYTNNTRVTNEDKYNTYLINNTSLEDEFYKTLEGRDYLNNTTSTEEIIEAFNKSIKKSMEKIFVGNRNFKVKDPNDVIRIIDDWPYMKRSVKAGALDILEDNYPDIYTLYKGERIAKSEQFKKDIEKIHREKFKQEQKKKKEEEEIRNRFK